MLNPRSCKPALAAALFALAATSASANPAHPCFYPEEQQSARIHDFQIMMMVGALKCRDAAPRSVGRYGAMLSDRDQEMAAHGDRLLSRMIDEWGYREGRRIFDTYETMLSNHYARQELTRQTCADLGAYAHMAHEATPAELETLSRLASRRSIAMCEYAPGAARAIPPRAEPLAGSYPERTVVRVIRGAVPPQVIAARARAETAPPEFPDMVSAPVAEPRIEEEAALAATEADAAADAAMAASAAATRIAAAEAEEAVSDPVAPQPANRLEEAITALDNAANALRNLRDEQAGGE